MSSRCFWFLCSPAWFFFLKIYSALLQYCFRILCVVHTKLIRKNNILGNFLWLTGSSGLMRRDIVKKKTEIFSYSTIHFAFWRSHKILSFVLCTHIKLRKKKIKINIVNDQVDVMFPQTHSICTYLCTWTIIYYFAIFFNITFFFPISRNYWMCSIYILFLSSSFSPCAP